MYWPNLNFVAFPVPAIIGGNPKNLGSPWIRPRSLFSKILMGFCSDGPYECNGQIWSPYIALPVPEIIAGSLKLCFGQSLVTPTRSLFSKIFNRLLFGWTLWMYRPNLKSASLPVPEIIGVIDFGSNWKRVCDFLLVRHSNLTLVLSCTISEILQVFYAPGWPHPLFHPNFRGVAVAPDRPCWGQPQQRP